MHPSIYRPLVVVGSILLTLLICGCGGGNHNTTVLRGQGSLQVRIHWPAQTQREIPVGSDLALIIVTSVSDPDVTIPPQVVSYSALASASVSTFYALPDGDCDVKVETFHANSVPLSYAPTLKKPTRGLIPADSTPTAVGYARVNVYVGQTAAAAVFLSAFGATPSNNPPAMFVTIRGAANGHKHLFAFSQIDQDPIDLMPNCQSDFSQPALSPNGQYVCVLDTNNGLLYYTQLPPTLSSDTLPTFHAFSQVSGTISSPVWAPYGEEIACVVNPYDRLQSPYVATCNLGDTTSSPTLLAYPPPGIPTAVTWCGWNTLLVVAHDATTSTENMYQVSTNQSSPATPILSAAVPVGTITSPTYDMRIGVLAYLENGTLKGLDLLGDDGDPFVAHPSGISSIGWLDDGAHSRLMMVYQPGATILPSLGLLNSGEGQPALITLPGIGDLQVAAYQPSSD